MIRNCGEGRHGKVRRAAISRQARAESERPALDTAGLTHREETVTARGGQSKGQARTLTATPHAFSRVTSGIPTTK